MDGQDSFTFPRHYKAAKGLIWLTATMGALLVVYLLGTVAVLLVMRMGTLPVFYALVTALLMVLAACYLGARRLVLELTFLDERTLLVRTRLTEQRVEVQSVDSVGTSSFDAWPRMRCGGRTYILPPAIDRGYEFLWILKTLNPSVKITNC